MVTTQLCAHKCVHVFTHILFLKRNNFIFASLMFTASRFYHESHAHNSFFLFYDTKDHALQIKPEIRVVDRLAWQLIRAQMDTIMQCIFCVNHARVCHIQKSRQVIPDITYWTQEGGEKVSEEDQEYMANYQSYFFSEPAATLKRSQPKKKELLDPSFLHLQKLCGTQHITK